MPPPRTIPLTSLEKYMGFIEAQNAEILWYRGVRDSSYDLKPSLYRHPKLFDADSLFRLEFEMLELFKQRGPLFLPTTLYGKENLDFLFLLQHYRIPTRLLDWTESPYIALYFALADAKYEWDNGEPVYDGDRLVYATSAAIWVLDPGSWNNHLFHYDPPPGILNPNDTEIIRAYVPRRQAQPGRPEPAALYGSHNNPRIVAQRGVFTIFGTSTDAMELTFENREFPNECLTKLEIPADTIGLLLERLIKIGFTDSVVFPELEGLAKEIKRSKDYLV